MNPTTKLQLTVLYHQIKCVVHLWCKHLCVVYQIMELGSVSIEFNFKSKTLAKSNPSHAVLRRVSN